MLSLSLRTLGRCRAVPSLTTYSPPLLSSRAFAAAKGPPVKSSSKPNVTSSSAPSSTAPASNHNSSHRPVIQLHGLAARYANATYVAASKANVLDQVETELLGLRETATTNRAFAGFLHDPMISRTEKTNFVESLDKLSHITRNLLATLAGNARLSELNKVVTDFERLMKARRGQVDAKIISAQELSSQDLQDIEAAIQSQIEKNKTVVLQAITDPSIVGGLQVQIGDQFLDLSVKSRIEEIAKTAV